MSGIFRMEIDGDKPPVPNNSTRKNGSSAPTSKRFTFKRKSVAVNSSVTTTTTTLKPEEVFDKDEESADILNINRKLGEMQLTQQDDDIVSEAKHDEEDMMASEAKHDEEDMMASEAKQEPLVKKKFQFTRQPVIKKLAGECLELFDPCTKEPVASLDILEKRIREIRNKRAEDNPETKKFPEEIKTRLDLLIDLLNKQEPPNNALFKYTINGQLYEAYWDIVFALNLNSDYVRTDDFYMISKKAEHVRHGESESYINDPIEYLKGRNVNEGASGASDISFCYKNNSEIIAEDNCSAPPFLKEGCSVGSVEPLVDKRMRYYFCSSKFYKRDSSKSAESFDIQKIYTAVKKLHENSDVRIILLVKDKDAVSIKLKNARNKYISEEASKVYGERDLFAALLKMYDLAHQKIMGEINEESLKNVLGITNKIKPILSPRLHQHMAIIKIEKAIKKFKMGGDNNKFLVGILPRGGKTYIAGGLVSVLQPKRVVVLLGAKSETISQFTNDLFRYYQDFADYQVVDVVEDTSKFTIKSDKKYIFVMSVELYKMEGSTREILIELKQGKNKADLFICDEAHLKQTTEKAIKAVEEGTLVESTDQEEEGGLADLGKIISRDVPIIFMSGTYIKPLKVFKIPDEHVAIWEYQDIQMGKNIVDNEQYFKDNFPGIYEEALAKSIAYGETLETIQAMYKRFPNLYLISTQFTDDAKGAFLKQGESGEKVGFPTLTHLFQVKKEFSPDSVKPSLWHTGFTNPSGIARLINYLSPKNEIETIDEKAVAHIPSVMRRIDRISQRIGDRLAFFTKEFVVHSQLWFLPSMQGHPLINRMSALGGIIFQSSWYKKNFNILAVSSSADWSKIPDAKERRINLNGGTFAWACPNGRDTLKACILQEEAAARAEGKGLIILAQNMLHLGISLTCVDIVVLLDAGEKVDERIQKMYRALTESTNKKGGFIVDLNYFRTLTAIMNYQIQTSKSRHDKEVYADSGLKEAFNNIIETYNIDDDLDIYSSKEEGGESRIESETIPELQRILQRAPTGRGDGITIDEVGAAMNKNIETALKGRDHKVYDYLLGEIIDDPEGKTLREEGLGVERAEEEKEEKDKVPRIKLFSDAVEKNPAEKRKAFNDIFKTALKIGVFGTSYKTLPELLDGIKVDGKLNNIIYETLVKRGSIQEGADPKEVKLIIEHEIKHIIAEKKDGSYRGMKETFNSKDSRSQRFEDVLKYIVEHLAPKDKERHKYGEVFTPLTLVDEMLSKLPAEVWSEKDYKWLDPANGIGNFPIKAFIGQKEGEHKYPGLFEGLKKKIPEDAKRCKWIVENMLYMIDINGKNNLVAKKLFEKLCPGAKANIEQIDRKNGFLADKPLEFNGKVVKEFDVVMGNPPYQSGAAKGKSTDKTRKMRVEMNVGQDKHKNIWIPFVKKLLTQYLKKDRFLLFINPINWFKPDRTGIHEELLKYQIKCMHIYDMYQSMKLFSGKGKINTAYYLLENKPVYTTTTVIDRLGIKNEITLNNKSIIILAFNSIFSKIQKKASLFYEGDEHKVTSIQTAKCNVGDNRQIHRISESGEITFVKTNVLHNDQHTPKIYLSGFQKPRFYYDKKGEYGLIGSHQHYFTGENLNKLEDYFKTKLSAILLMHTKYDQEFIEPKYYPDVRSIPLEKITDETLADYFGFTSEERKSVNAVEYPKREYKFKEITCAQLKGEKDDVAEGGARNVTRKLHRS